MSYKQKDGGIKDFQDLQISEAAAVDTSGPTGGTIKLQGKNIDITGNSAIFSQTNVTGIGQDVEINVTELVSLSGDATRLSTSTVSNGTGGNLALTAKKLTLVSGAYIETSTNGEGKAGNILIKVPDTVELSGTTSDGTLPTGLFSYVNPNALGDSGNINIETRKLLIQDGAAVNAYSYGTSKVGSLFIKALNVELLGESFNQQPSAIVSQVYANGDSGNLTIETQQLSIRDGAIIDASTFGQGKAGDLYINATDFIELSGVGQQGNVSGIFAQVAKTAEKVQFELAVRPNCTFEF